MDIFLSIFSFLFGAIVGSFLNALIYRLPREINIAHPRSSCPHCGKLIYWYENIPILSYVFLKGRCSNCHEKISIQYPLIEFGCGVVALLISPKNYSIQEIYSFVFFFTVFAAFLVHFIVDLKHQILPDLVNLYLAIVFLIIGIINYPILHWSIGAVLGLAFPYAVSFGFYKIKGQVGLGGGDIKLWGALGLYLGPMGILQNIFLSCFVGALFGGILLGLKIIKREHPIAFGPFIILIASIQIYFPNWFAHTMRYIS